MISNTHFKQVISSYLSNDLLGWMTLFHCPKNPAQNEKFPQIMFVKCPLINLLNFLIVKQMYANVFENFHEVLGLTRLRFILNKNRLITLFCPHPHLPLERRLLVLPKLARGGTAVWILQYVKKYINYNIRYQMANENCKIYYNHFVLKVYLF